MVRCELLPEHSLGGLQAYCRALGLRAKNADWLGAEGVANELAAAWGAVRPSILRGLAGRGTATALDGTVNWIAVAIGRRDALSTLKASAELAREVESLRGLLAA
jgi:hypothetical protein